MVNNEKMEEILDNASNTIIGKRSACSQDNSIEKLRSAFQNRKLVLVLGAGVSREYGLPDWNTLIQKLLIYELDKTSKNSKDESGVLAKIFDKLFNPNPLIAARYLKNQYMENSNNANTDAIDHINGTNSFNLAVKEIIYDEIKQSIFSSLFNEIKELCVQSHEGSLDSIITYNYDDILEMNLSEGNNISYKSIYSSSSINYEEGEMPIYHVHGYLPREGHSCSDEIILSEDVYHQQYNDSFNWSNFIQINKFASYTCLFIGVSLSDPNLRRLLDISRKLRSGTEMQHYIIRERKKFDETKKKLQHLLENDNDLKREKIDAEMTLGSTCRRFKEMIENFQENDAASFNVGTIWVEDHLNIPRKLKEVRSKDN